MPIHDWTRVEAGIFHAFHHSWIEEIQRGLNGGVLPDTCYAMIEQSSMSAGPHAPLAMPPAHETEMAFYRRKQNTVTIRHVNGDRMLAMVEVVSPANKESRNALRSFVEKAAGLLTKGIHLLILDLHPPGPCDPHGIHGAIWEDITGEDTGFPPPKPLALVSYEAATAVRAYVETIAVGDVLGAMPLFLNPDTYIPVPLEATYQGAFAAMPRRWRRVLET